MGKLLSNNRLFKSRFSTDGSLLTRVGVDFSQVDLSAFYVRIGLILALVHLAAIFLIPDRSLSAPVRKIWRVTLVVILGVGWVSVVVGFVWPEVLRGHDGFTIMSMIGGLIVMPIVTLLASFVIWLRQR